MQMFTSGLFWGTLLIIIGLSVILKAIFGINLPIIRILLGVLIIYLGMRVIIGGFSKTVDFGEDAFFGNSHLTFTQEQKDYSILFGTGTIDLRPVKDSDKKERINSGIIFGKSTIILPKGEPFKVDLSAAFGKVELDEKSINGIGDTVWYSPEYKDSEESNTLKASAVFGSMEIVRK